MKVVLIRVIIRKGKVSLGKFNFKSKTPTSNWLKEANDQVVVFNISDPTIQNQCKAIGLALKDIKISKAIQPLILEHAQHIAGEFYRALYNIADFNVIISKHSNPERWIHKHAEFLMRMFDGTFDDSYIDYLYQLAKGHQAIGVLSQWYVASFQALLQSIQNCLLRTTLSKEDFSSYLIAFQKY